MNQKLIIYSVLGLIIAGVALSVVYTNMFISSDSDPASDTLHDKTLGDITGENVTFTITEREHKKWELRVQKAIYYKDQSGAKLEGITGEFYDDQGKPVASFKAPRGSYIDQHKAVKLVEGVEVVSVDDKGGKLKAPSMTWSTKKDLVYAEGGVELDMGGYAMAHAERCEFSLDFSTVSLSGNARSEIDF